jgi:PTH1 family peptidyl-tRNA hydrolase
MKYIVGLGNPNEEYEGTRHNIGRDFVKDFGRKNKFPEFEYDKKINAQISEGKIGKEKVMLILPDTYMNKSGASLKKYITSVKKAKDLVVIHDDIDMAIGKLKIVFGKKSGGHKGVESIKRAIKTTDFVRFKIGISPVTPKGKIKKPSGEEKVIKHVLGKWNDKEKAVLKKTQKHVLGAIEATIKDGYLSAMNGFN